MFKKNRPVATAVVIGSLVSAVDAIAYGILIPVLPFIVLSFDASPVVVTQLVAIFGFATFLGAPAIGRMSDRIGRRPVLNWSLLATALLPLVMFVHWSLAALFVVRAFGGALAGRGAVVRALATDGLAADQHVRSLGWVAAAGNIGAVVGPMIGGLMALALTKPEDHFRGVLLATGGLSALALVLASVWQPAGPPAQAARANNGTPQTRLKGLIWTVWRPLTLVATTSYAYGVLISVTALLVARRFGWGPEQTGALLGAAAAIFAISRVKVVPLLTNRFGVTKALTGGLVLGAPSLAGVGLANDPAVFVIAFLLFACSVSVSMMLPTVLVSMAADPAHRGHLFGWAQGVGAVATALSASLNGFLFEYVDLAAPHIAGALALLAAASLLVFRKRPHRAATQATVSQAG